MSEQLRAREKPRGHERCPYCHEEFAVSDGDGSERVACAGCGTPHHAECFAENGGCSSLGCERAVARVEGAGEVAAGLVVDGVRSRRGDPLALILFALGALIGVAGVAARWPPAIFIGLVVFGLGLFFGIGIRLLERAIRRAADIRALEGRQDPPPPFPIPRAPPLTGIEAAQLLNSTARSREPLREPQGETRPCPACARPLEGAPELAFCYHCGAPLA